MEVVEEGGDKKIWDEVMKTDLKMLNLLDEMTDDSSTIAKTPLP